MQASTVLNHVIQGEARQLGIVDVGALTDASERTGVQNRNLRAMMSYLNLGILELCKRFNLKMDEQTFAIGSYARAHELIKTCLVPVYVVTEYGEHPLNDDAPDMHDEMRFFTPSPHQVTISGPIDEAVRTMSVVFRAQLPEVVDLEEYINLSDSYLSPLVTYITTALFTGIVTNKEGDPNLRVLGMQKFQTECDLIETQGLVATDTASNHRFKKRGFI